ncbi:MAG: hypothetical protein BGN96_14255 [Bacteroidales bacterium 45-6]|nr:MAG: hypothetical protein BGN96_14255 [Bacteroidales bacterium 45-6]
MKLFHKTLFLAFVSAAFFSCKKEYPQADSLLSDARSFYASGHFAEAKKALDSIQKVSPKAFSQINAGLALLDSIRYGENIRIVTQSDSLLKLMEARIEQQKRLFTYEINPKYQDKGCYIPKAYPNSMAAMGFRSGVEADGKLYLESVADRPIKHFAAVASIPGGQRAETKAVTDDGANYRFQVEGQSAEVVRYSGKRENGVAAFIAANQTKNITVMLKATSPTSFTLTAQAKRGILDSYTLSRLLTTRDSVRFNLEKSKRLIKYLDKKRAKEMARKAEKQLTE